MKITERQHQLLTLCAVRVDGRGLDWSLVARLASEEDGLALLYRGEVAESSAAGRAAVAVLREGLANLSSYTSRVDEEIAAAESVRARLVTVLDDDYPANLRTIPNRPPFLFYHGELRADDAYSIAVVGTRAASAEGLNKATTVADALAKQGVTVTSGLARGIDTAAHRAALDSGSRTIAVIGTGITRCYPPENEELAEEIIESGAVVSQFWPTRGPGRDTFPRRNVVTSGISQGSVIIEASSTSGAKMQARIAAEHGKRVFVLPTLVEREQWAQRMVARGTATIARSVGDILPLLATADTVRRVAGERQLALGLM